MIIIIPNYNEALKRPFTDIKKLIIGLILSVIPIVNFIASGYQLKCASSVMKKSKKMYELPEWTNILNLFLLGLMSFVIAIVYFIPSLAVAFLVGGRLVLDDITNLTYGSIGFPAIVIVLLTLLSLYLLPMALTKYSSKEKFKDAFQFREIFARSFTWNYFAAWIFSAIVFIVLVLVLSWVKFNVGSIEVNLGSSFANFIAMVIGFTIFGRVYGSKK